MWPSSLLRDYAGERTLSYVLDKPQGARSVAFGCISSALERLEARVQKHTPLAIIAHSSVAPLAYDFACDLRRSSTFSVKDGTSLVLLVTIGAPLALLSNGKLPQLPPSTWKRIRPALSEGAVVLNIWSRYDPFATRAELHARSSQLSDVHISYGPPLLRYTKLSHVFALSDERVLEVVARALSRLYMTTV